MVNRKRMVRFRGTDYWRISCEGMQLTVFVCSVLIPLSHLEDFPRLPSFPTLSLSYLVCLFHPSQVFLRSTCPKKLFRPSSSFLLHFLIKAFLSFFHLSKRCCSKRRRRKLSLLTWINSNYSSCSIFPLFSGDFHLFAISNENQSRINKSLSFKFFN